MINHVGINYWCLHICPGINLIPSEQNSLLKHIFLIEKHKIHSQ